MERLRESTGKPQKEIMRMLGENWKSLSAEERAPFQTQADESKGDWERESSEYKKKKDAAKANAPPGFPLGMPGLPMPMPPVGMAPGMAGLLSGMAGMPVVPSSVASKGKADEDEEDEEPVDTPFRGGGAGKKRKAPASKNKSGAKKAKSSGAKGGAKKRSDDGEKKERKPGGFAKTKYHLSPDLAAVVGEPTMARPQIVKQLWVYIRAKELQDPACKRDIICDAKLKKIFAGESKVTMFSMNKFIGAHIKGKVEEPEP
mmetsp:Transcript_109849/g.319629  ORF Transcript_109849/g.319629 Transcript_109849/m.319629 type:complete len:259 (+) Transcript_109849:870-1646(+)